MNRQQEVDFPHFVWIWNWHQGLETPRLHVAMARWLMQRWRDGDRELLLLAFRSSGKSTLVGLFCAWLRIPTIATTRSDRSRPAIPDDRDQCGAGVVAPLDVDGDVSLRWFGQARRRPSR